MRQKIIKSRQYKKDLKKLNAVLEKNKLMISIKHLFHINASKKKVFEAVTTIKGLGNWWTINTSGDSKPGWKIN